ncbi:hypothetical protein N8I71_19285 [Roseibacterium sp. SDUM158016]|jgi:uncharacterized protein YjiS (DUF1127 family)|uniref:hypothetical protein n=1 Tax=Roseicyclus sediminis TaxID=2980997 RepID=UPI0021D32417|nr:hypothetical protein [Roseibacterium sp. SDUM158016]MCU4654989.1 hypothetical protein [Roseibacterium sp. SDUM158016]
MTSIITYLRSAAEKRAAYNRTVAEIARLNRDLAIEDLGIYPGDAELIARKAVYGA